jgi:uncharacterized protein (TIGR00369 family)
VSRDEPVRGAAAYPGLAARSGVEQLVGFMTGRAPDPPVARLTGRRIVHASYGTATYALPATAWMLGPRGVLHSGVLALLADGALVASVISGLPARTLCTTAELSMTFLGTLPHGRGDVLARGRLLHLDAQMGLAEVYVSNAAGRLVAHGTSRCSVFPPFDDSVELIPPAPVPGEAAHETPDPYRRPMAAMQPPRSTFSSDGVELLRARMRGDVPPPAIDQLTGMRLVAADEGEVVFAMPAQPWLANEWGTVYGGMTTLLAKSATAAVVQSTAPAGTRYTALDVKVNFLRAIPVDGRDQVARGTLLHRGRRLAIATADIMHGQERVAVATGSTALTPP